MSNDITTTWKGMLAGLVFFLLVSPVVAGELFEAMRLAGNYPVDTHSSSQETRLLSYRNALKSVFPEIPADSFRIEIERRDDRYGTLVRLNQYYRNLQVMGSGAVIVTDFGDQAIFASVTAINGVDLPDEPFLADAKDSIKLTDFVRLYWAGADTDTTISAQPWVYAIPDSNGDVSLAYALLTWSRQMAPARYLDWETGAVLWEIRPENHTISVSIPVYTKARTFEDNVQEVFDAPNLGHTYATFHGDGGSWDVEHTDCEDPATGNCTNLFVGNNVEFPYFGLQIIGQNHYLRVWTTSRVDVFGDHYNIDYSRPYQSAFVVGIPMGAPEDLGEYEIPLANWDNGEWEDPIALYNVNTAMQWYKTNFGVGNGHGIAVDPMQPDPIPFCDIITSWDNTIWGATDRTDQYNYRIWFGRAYNNDWWSEYRDTAWHEYAHVWQNRWCSVMWGDNCWHESSWIHEGEAQFAAACLANTNLLRTPGYFNTTVTDNIVKSSDQYGVPYTYSHIGQLECESHERGVVLQSALWEMRNNIESYGSVPTGWNNVSEYALGLASAALMSHPGQFPGMAQAILYWDAVFTGDNNPADGTPNGQAIYDALIVRREITDPNNAFRYYKCIDAPTQIQTSTTTALGSGGSVNMVKGQFGTYTVWEDNGAVNLSRSTNDGQTWLTKRLNDVNHPGSLPTLTIQQVFEREYVHVAWVFYPYPSYRSVRYCRYEFSEMSPCHLNTLTPDVDRVVGDSDELYDLSIASTLDMIYIVHSGTLHWEDEATGIVCTRLTNSGAGTQTSDFIPGSSPAATTYTALAQDPHFGYLYAAWCVNNTVYLRKGPSWNSYSLRVVSPATDGHTSKRNVTVSYDLATYTVAVAWDALNSSTQRREIGYNRSHMTADGSDPAFPDPLYLSGGRCVSLAAPSLNTFRADGTSEPGYPQFGLAYESREDWETVPQIVFRALRITNPNDYSTWYWRNIHTSSTRGNAPSLGNATIAQGYQVFFVQSNTASPYRLRLEFETTTPAGAPIEISGNETWIAPMVIDGPVTVKQGASLLLSPYSARVPIYCAENVASSYSFIGGVVTVEPGGVLIVDGDPEDPITLEANDKSTSWSGIVINGGQLWMENVQMLDCDSGCVTVINPEKIGTDRPVNIDHCTFDGSKLVEGADAVRIIGNPEPDEIVVISNTTIENVAKSARGLYLFGCPVDVDSLTVRDCNTMNSLIEEVTGTFHGCTFETTSNKDRPSDYGIVLVGAATTPLFTCCTFNNIAPPEGAALDALAGTAPIFGWESEPASNVFRESEDLTACLLKMHGDAPLPVITLTQNGGGENDWYHADRDGVYIYWKDWPAWTYPAWKQYWDPTPTVDNFYPSDPYAFDFAIYETDPWGVCRSARASSAGHGGGAMVGGSLDDAASDSVLFRQAVDAERLENHGVAQGLFGTLARTTTLRGLRWQAMAHVVGTQRHLATETWIPGLIDSLITVENNAYATRVYGKRLLASYRADREDFTAAAGVYTTLLGSGLTAGDSLLVALDLVGVQLRSGFQASGGGLDADVVPSTLKISSIPEGIALQAHLLAAMKDAKGGRATTSAVLPTQYALYQNYPNPFNPVTEIRFDLPEKAQVELKIFNTLGQLVTTLVNEVRPTGAYTVQWDGNNAAGIPVATGMYIYQLKAGSFTDTKKMLLMK